MASLLCTCLYTWATSWVPRGKGEVIQTDLLYYLVWCTLFSCLEQDLGHFVRPTFLCTLLKMRVILDGLVGGRLFLREFGLFLNTLPA